MIERVDQIQIRTVGIYTVKGTESHQRVRPVGIFMSLIRGDTNREEKVPDAHPGRCGLMDIVTGRRGPRCCRYAYRNMSVVAANVNGSVKSIDIERAGLRQRSHQRRRPISKATVG